MGTITGIFPTSPADTVTTVAAPNCPTSASETAKITLYPRIAVLEERIKSGEPITQATIKEIYDMAFSLLKHRHSYTDLIWIQAGNTSPYPDKRIGLWTDYPLQLNGLVELGGPLMQGVVFEKWYLCPDAYNVRVLDSAPMIYTRQYKLPEGGGLVYDARTGLNIPQNLQQTSLGAIITFYLDTSDVINVPQTLKLNTSGNAIVYIDNVEHGFYEHTQEITFVPKNLRTHISLHWIEGDTTPWVTAFLGVFYLVNNINTQGYVEMLINGAPILTNKITSLTPQVSLNTTVTDANITSIYALYQIMMILCNHSHKYLDYDVYAGNKSFSASSTIQTLENLYKTQNEKISFQTQSYGWTDPDTGQPIFGGYQDEITGVSMFSQPVVL